MAGEPQISIIGNLTGDPELRFIQSGAAVCNFTVASTPRTFDRQANEWKDGETLFMRCALWREAAENAAESLTKGMRVIVTGVLKSKPYEKDGEKRSNMELEVDEVGPSLKYATAKVERKGIKPSTIAVASAGYAPASTEADPWANVPASDSPPF